MTYYIDDDKLQENNLSLDEFIVLWGQTRVGLDTFTNNIDVGESLIKKGLIADNSTYIHGIEDAKRYAITKEGEDLLNKIFSSSDKDTSKKKTDAQLLLLAANLKEVFPKGLKVGTNNYWSDGKALIVKRLKLFIRKYGADFKDEDVIDAAKRYVESFNGNYNFMRTLKYFIFKEGVNADGDKESSSDLLTWMENKAESIAQNNDWASDLK
jgi:hypothetical protein